MEIVKAEYTAHYDMPWAMIEMGIRLFLDNTFDDKLFLKMSDDEKIDDLHCREEFGSKKPSVIDYILWSGKYVTHSEYVEIPDEKKSN